MGAETCLNCRRKSRRISNRTGANRQTETKQRDKQSWRILMNFVESQWLKFRRCDFTNESRTKRNWKRWRRLKIKKKKKKNNRNKKYQEENKDESLVSGFL